MGASNTKPKGPTNAFLGADGRPYYEPDPDEERRRCCCVYVGRGLLRILLAITMLAILGLGAAALIAGPRKYWTYYVNKNPGTANTLGFYKIRTGYLKYEQQGFASSAAVTVRDLKDIDQAMFIIGIITAVVTVLSCLLALYQFISVLAMRISRAALCCYIPFALLQVGAGITYYILVAIYISQHLGQRFNKSSVPWPDWGWFFVVGAGLLWLVASILTLMMPKPTKHIPTQYLQEDAARARGWSLAQNAPQAQRMQDPEAARLPGNAPSSAPVNDVQLQFHPKGSFTQQKSGKGGAWFGGKGKENPSYNTQAQQIADRYRGRGGANADIEMPGAYYNRK